MLGLVDGQSTASGVYPLGASGEALFQAATGTARTSAAASSTVGSRIITEAVNHVRNGHWYEQNNNGLWGNGVKSYQSQLGAGLRSRQDLPKPTWSSCRIVNNSLARLLARE